MRIRSIIPVLLLFGIACVPIKTSVTRTSNKTFNPKPTDCDIQVLSQPPTNRKFEEIAILSTLAVEWVYGKDLDSMLPSIKEAACRLGADAVLIKNVEPGSPYDKGAGKAYSVAIKYID
jgi:hypothetical protein